MQKTFILFLSQAVFLVMTALGQNNRQPYIFLTNYTISKEHNFIGYVNLN